MIPDQPAKLIVHVVVMDLEGSDAYNYTDDDGESVCVVDEAFLRNDPMARASAFRAFVTQAAEAKRRPTVQLA